MKLIRKIKELFALSDRLIFIESEMNELQTKVNNIFDDRLKEFEKKIQTMTFAYTKNLDDTKSDYLKRYVETRLDCIQSEVSRLPSQINRMNSDISEISRDLREITHALEHKKD